MSRPLKSASSMANNRVMGDGRFAQLLAGAKAGDEAAWAVIFGDLAGPVVGYLRSHGAAEPEDLGSEAFLRVARSIGGFEGDERGFRSWVFTIVHRLLLDEHRSRTRRPAPEPIDGVDGETDRAGVTEPAELIAERHADDAGVIALVGRLTEDQRDVVLLRIVGGFSIEEVARLVDKPSGAVKQLQRRGLASLKRMLTDGEEPG